MSKKGIFITFEGGEGCGKSTHSRLLKEYLKKSGYKVLHTREPGGTFIGEEIRHILLDPKNTAMDRYTEMFLYMAARLQILKEVIIPALDESFIVICDRFMDSTYAYQGYAGGLDIKLIKNIGRTVTRHPDLTFFLDIDAKDGLKRSRGRKDRMERKDIIYHNKVREGFLKIRSSEPKRVRLIDASDDIRTTESRIRDIIVKYLSKRKYGIRKDRRAQKRDK